MKNKPKGLTLEKLIKANKIFDDSKGPRRLLNKRNETDRLILEMFKKWEEEYRETNKTL